MSPRGEGLILRKITTEYKFVSMVGFCRWLAHHTDTLLQPLRFPDRITVYHRLTTKPDRSDALLLSCVILSERHQRIAARTTEDIALYDYDKAAKVDKQPWLVQTLEEAWILQQTSQKVNADRVGALLEQVRQLELASWDRTDAAEDMGSA